MTIFLLKSDIISGHEKMFHSIYDNYNKEKKFIDLNLVFDWFEILKYKKFIISVGYPAQNLFLVLFLKLLRKNIYVYTPFGFELKYFNVRFSRVKEFFYRSVYFGNNIKYITCSEAQSELLKNRFVNKEVFFVNNFSDGSYNSVNSISEINSKDVFYIGRIDQVQKNCLFFVDLASKNDYKIHLIGSCSDIYLNRKLSIQNIKIHNYTSEPFSLLNVDSCLVLPSFYEGAPLIIIEACIHNIPIFISDCVGNKNFADDALIFSSILDLQELLKLHFNKDTLLNDRWIKFRNDVLAKYNKEIFLAQLSVLENIIECD